MGRFARHPLRSAALLFVTGWIVWFFLRDSALRACFPGQAVIATFPGDPGAVCQDLVGYVPWILLAASIVVAVVWASIRRRSTRMDDWPSGDIHAGQAREHPRSSAYRVGSNAPCG